MQSLTLRRLGGDPPWYEVPAAAARAVADDVFQSDRLLRDDGTLRLSPANVFTATEKALGRGTTVVIAGGDEAERRCTPGDASALADEFRAVGRTAAADAWEAKHGDGAFAAVWIQRPQSSTPKAGLAVCRVRARSLRVCEFEDDVSLARLEAALAGEGCREVLVVSTGDGAAAADVAKRCGAAITKVPPASYGGPPQEIQRALAERCGGDAAEEAARSVPPVALKACAAVLERLAATDPATGPRVLDFDLALDDPTTCLRLDAATLRALALVDDDSVLALLRGHAATAAGRKRLEAWLRRPLADVPTLKARQAAVASLVEDETARQGTRRALKHRSCADADRLAAAFARESIPLRDLVAAHALRERLVSCATALAGDGLRDVKQAVGRAAKSLEKLALLVEEVVDVEALPRVSGVPVSRRDETPSIAQAAQGADVPLRRARPSLVPPRRRRGRAARGSRRRRSDPVPLPEEAREARQDDAEAETRARRPAGSCFKSDQGRRRGGAEGLARDAARDAARRRGAVHDEGRRAARLGPAPGVERLSCGIRRDSAGMFEAVWKSNFYGAFVLNNRVVLHAIDATPA
jgi:hypothetical protein